MEGNLGVRTLRRFIRQIKKMNVLTLDHTAGYRVNQRQKNENGAIISITGKKSRGTGTNREGGVLEARGKKKGVSRGGQLKKTFLWRWQINSKKEKKTRMRRIEIDASG